MKKFKAYWWHTVPNFGDALAPLLLERFAHIKVEWDTVSHASIASIGSILEHIPPLWDGHIIGSGKLHEFSKLHLHTNTATIWAIRGPLSAKGIGGSFVLGDPGVLADELVGPQEKIWNLGIVPHWQDHELTINPRRWCPVPYTFKIIDPTKNPLDVIRQIGQCEKIVTSSLHGMIVADAFRLPRRIEVCKAMVNDGGLFKFKDYSESIQLPFETGKLQAASHFRVEDLAFELFDAYHALGEELRKG